MALPKSSQMSLSRSYSLVSRHFFTLTLKVLLCRFWSTTRIRGSCSKQSARISGQFVFWLSDLKQTSGIFGQLADSWHRHSSETSGMVGQLLDWPWTLLRVMMRKKAPYKVRQGQLWGSLKVGGTDSRLETYHSRRSWWGHSARQLKQLPGQPYGFYTSRIPCLVGLHNETITKKCCRTTFGWRLHDIIVFQG